MPRLPPVPPPTPSFFLSDPPRAPGEHLLLTGEELEHARVLRLEPGTRCRGLDGRGHVWPLELRSLRRARVELVSTGPPREEPPPGASGARLPWIELAVSWPRRTRAGSLLGTLVQLGAAAVTPLAAQHRGAEACPDLGQGRWPRIAREALKQSGRTWLPELGSPHTPAELVRARPGAVLGLLDPDGGSSCDTWLRSLHLSSVDLGTHARPLVLAVGPEGGFTAAERDALLEAGAAALWLAPHVLRIETAAAAAMAVAACALGSPGSLSPGVHGGHAGDGGRGRGPGSTDTGPAPE